MRKKVCLLIYIIFFSFLLVGHISAETYQFTCGYSKKSDFDKYLLDDQAVNFESDPNGDNSAVLDDNSNVITSGYRSVYAFRYERTGLSNMKIVSCSKSVGNKIVDNNKVETIWGKCEYDYYEFDFNGNEEVLDNQIWCPGAIDIEGNVVKLKSGFNNAQYVYVSGRNDKNNVSNFTNSCTEYISSYDCKDSPDVACVWVEHEDAPGGGYCNTDNLLYVGCGGSNDIPVQVPALISLFVNLLKIATPIILIFVSIITLLKAMAAQKEDEIKKATSSLVKKIIAAAMVFFVIAIVQYIISIVASDEEDYGNFTNCLDCFLNNSCETSTYYKTVSYDIEYCTPLETGVTDICEKLFK